MSGYQTIEYYQTCPSCGANNNGKEFCEYCGSSLVKSTTRTEYESPVKAQEYANEAEDAMLPIIEGKYCGIDSFLLLFCPIFGGGFILIPTILCIAFVSSGIMEGWAYAMFGLFWMIGIGAMIPLFVSISRSAKCKKGERITGIVRGYEEDHSVLINGRPRLCVRILVEHNGTPSILVLSTGGTNRRYALGQQVTLRNYDDKYVFEKS